MTLDWNVIQPTWFSVIHADHHSQADYRILVYRSMLGKWSQGQNWTRGYPEEGLAGGNNAREAVTYCVLISFFLLLRKRLRDVLDVHQFYVIVEPQAFLAGEVVPWLAFQGSQNRQLLFFKLGYLATMYVHFVEIITSVKLKNGYVD